MVAVLALLLVSLGGPASGQTTRASLPGCGTNFFGGGWPESELTSVRLSTLDRAHEGLGSPVELEWTVEGRRGRAPHSSTGTSRSIGSTASANAAWTGGDERRLVANSSHADTWLALRDHENGVGSHF